MTTQSAAASCAGGTAALSSGRMSCLGADWLENLAWLGRSAALRPPIRRHEHTFDEW
jgi:hypothetical protein